MDFGNFSDNLPLILTVIGLIVLQFFLRRRAPREATHEQVVQNLLSEVKMNLGLCQAFTYDHRSRKFTTTTWMRNQNRLSFLPQETQTVLNDAFTMAEDFNQQIAAARKYKSASYMASVNADRLGKVLEKCQQALEDWLKAKTGSTEPQVKIPGVFGDWTGQS